MAVSFFLLMLQKSICKLYDKITTMAKTNKKPICMAPFTEVEVAENGNVNCCCLQYTTITFEFSRDAYSFNFLTFSFSTFISLSEIFLKTAVLKKFGTAEEQRHLDVK